MLLAAALLGAAWLAGPAAAQGAFSPAQRTEIEQIIKQYLVKNPEVLQEAIGELEKRQQESQKVAQQAMLAQAGKTLFNSPHGNVIGNPAGDVTLVEFFDYNCGYCRAALPDMAALLAEDPNLRVIFKEFPILSNESIDAARVAVLVGDADVDYWAFHEALFSSRGKVDKKVALTAATDLGLSQVNLELGMGSAEVSETIQTSYEIAKALNITGTPTYIIGNEIIPGAIGIDELRTRIANMRACGQTQCDS